MTDPDLSTYLETAVAGECERLKRLPPALLRVLGHDGVTRLMRREEQSFEIKAWSVPGATEAFVVLVGALEAGARGPTHVRGFMVKADGAYVDLSDAALRSYEEP